MIIDIKNSSVKYKLIINADDCGFSTKVNQRIEEEILAHRITSTTVMSNMSDFDGAVRLYKEYGRDISFGIHLNMTEGTPLLYNDCLLQTGLLKESAMGAFY